MKSLRRHYAQWIDAGAAARRIAAAWASGYSKNTAEIGELQRS